MKPITKKKGLPAKKKKVGLYSNDALLTVVGFNSYTEFKNFKPSWVSDTYSRRSAERNEKELKNGTSEIYNDDTYMLVAKKGNQLVKILGRDRFVRGSVNEQYFYNTIRKIVNSSYIRV